MNHKTAGKLTGIAFIAATAAGVASLSFIDVINHEGYMQNIAANPTGLTIGAILVMIMGLACAAIAYCIYPVLSRHHKGLAIGAVGFRTIEGGLFILSSAALLALVTSAKQGYDGTQIKALQEAISLGPTLAFCIGALLYNIGFYKAKLVPRWLSVWGIIALSLHIVASVAALFGMDSFSPIGLVLNMPIAFQEMVMAVYLIIFGFKTNK